MPGGAVSFIRSIKVLDKIETQNAAEVAGVDIVRQALKVPLATIANNAGEHGSVVVAKVLESKDANFGFNALSLNYVDMIKDGIMTPAKVDRTALENAASVATLLLTCDCIITEKPVAEEAGGGDHDHGMGGMGGGGMPGMGGMGGMGGMPGMM